MENRFYPSFVPPYKKEPTKEKFQVYDGEFGKQIKTLVPFKRGDILFIYSGVITDEITQHSLQYKNTNLNDIWFMGYIAHSCSPNCDVYANERRFTALRDIEAGELITMNYSQTEKKLFKQFNCTCGSANCRGTIK